ncbi:unnamed protein product [Blepharisma stoltei]|uniref:Uncharacterized protein n=1 Tax=Blepharisma stoltei TaxID=1481888 RepID=A0AAU9JX24_9CILI|nr:unnamed protein product [Blepharisma stoltei]
MSFIRPLNLWNYHIWKFSKQLIAIENLYLIFHQINAYNLNLRRISILMINKHFLLQYQNFNKQIVYLGKLVIIFIDKIDSFNGSRNEYENDSARRILVKM